MRPSHAAGEGYDLRPNEQAMIEAPAFLSARHDPPRAGAFRRGQAGLVPPDVGMTMGNRQERAHA